MSVTKEYIVEGMACAHCEKTVKDALMQWDEVEDVQIDLPSGKVTVHLTTPSFDEEKILESIKEAGYTVR